jgi:hypothetical protein
VAIKPRYRCRHERGIFGVGNMGSSHPDPIVSLLVLLGLLVGVGGVVLLIRAAIRRPRAPGGRTGPDLSRKSANQLANKPLFFGDF